MKNGMKNSAIKERCPQFTDSHGMIFDEVYVGKTSFFREGRLIWSEETGIKRLSKKAAINDAEKQSSDILQRHLSN